MATNRERACGYYRNQDLRVLRAFTPDGHTRPDFVIAHIRGHQRTLEVRLEAGAWTCSCELAADPDCAHRATVQMATGYRSSAAAPVKAGAQ